RRDAMVAQTRERLGLALEHLHVLPALELAGAQLLDRDATVLLHVVACQRAGRRALAQQVQHAVPLTDDPVDRRGSFDVHGQTSPFYRIWAPFLARIQLE